MRYTIKLFVLLSALALVGCAAPVVHIQEPSPPLAPPQKLVQNCDLIAPPNIDIYSLSPPDKKEELLYTFSMAQMNSIVLCNKKQEKLRLWISEQQRLHMLTKK